MREPGYRASFRERLGFLPSSFHSTGAGAIWFHAVSVGEVLSAVTLIRRLRTEEPQACIYVSTTTLAGKTLADRELSRLAQGVFYAPLDYRSIVRRVLRRLRPALVVVLETEIWPNLYREAKRAGASLLVVNGRISDRALPRYRRWRWFFRHVLGFADSILAQSEEDRNRYIAAGAQPSRVRVAGNLKFDFISPAAGIAPDIARFLDGVNAESIWIAASTMPPLEAGDIDEDDAVIAAFDQVRARRNRTLLILAPRKPERFDVVAEKLERSGISFVRRTSLAQVDLPGVLLLDSIGELAALFERADVVFMGGTLARRGGHNILEPAYFGKPVIVGPHMENFAAIAKIFYKSQALARIEDARDLSNAVSQLLDDPAQRAALGSRARELALSKRGVVALIAKEIWLARASGIPNPPRVLAARVALTPLTWVWRAGHCFNMKRGLSARRTLETPVVSIGSLAMGGAGKTPMVAHLASRLREAGRNPAILTRGYQRRSPQRILIVPRGGKAPKEITGDEAQILIRAGDVHVGIGGNRFEVGRRMEQELAPDIFLLDDGFQHVRLARCEDIVLIDALDPLGIGIFPLGRLREPIKSLARATMIVVTRVEPGQDIGGIERLLRRYNAQAPVFRSRVVPKRWIDLEGGTARDVTEPGFRRVAAFCGLGAPRSFWRTLEQLGLEVAFRATFPDHHPYRAAELSRLAERATEAGAEALVTTGKDAMNLPDGAAAMLAPLKLLWLEIGIEIDREDEFLRRLML